MCKKCQAPRFLCKILTGRTFQSYASCTSARSFLSTLLRYHFILKPHLIITHCLVGDCTLFSRSQRVCTSEFAPAREPAVIPEPEPEPESILKRACALGRVLEFAEVLELSFRVRLYSLYLTVLLCVGVCLSIRLSLYHRVRTLSLPPGKNVHRVRTRPRVDLRNGPSHTITHQRLRCISGSEYLLHQT